MFLLCLELSSSLPFPFYPVVKTECHKKLINVVLQILICFNIEKLHSKLNVFIFMFGMHSADVAKEAFGCYRCFLKV